MSAVPQGKRMAFQREQFFVQMLFSPCLKYGPPFEIEQPSEGEVCHLSRVQSYLALGILQIFFVRFRMVEQNTTVVFTPFPPLSLPKKYIYKDDLFSLIMGNNS
jgi:hypothetical protein